MSYGYANQSYAFDPASVPEEDREDRFEPIPAGEYVVVIVDSEVKPTRAGGEGINFRFQIQGPHHAGRVLFHWVNTRVPSSTEAERIGRSELYKMTAAAGGGQAFRWQATSELHGRPFVVRVRIMDDPEYGPQNKVKGYKVLPSMLQQAAAAAGAAPPPPPQQAAPPDPGPPQNMDRREQQSRGIQPGGYGGYQPAGPRADVPPPGDSDIPF